MKTLALASLLALFALTAVAEPPKLAGTIASLKADGAITLKTADGKTAQLRLTKSTVYAHEDGSAASRADLAEGKRVAIAVAADGKSATAVEIAAPLPKVVLVESKSVCMINDRAMAIEQIPVVIEGKTYFGCCPMCKERLEKDAASRYAVDPVSGKKVDKAKAVIGALPGAVVVYFESAENLARYNAGMRAAQ